MMPNNYRTSDFKLGCIHGKQPSKSCKEAKIRNFIYGTGLLLIKQTTCVTKIRVVGYEVPIWKKGTSRVECIDLLGYDESFMPWIIELKQKESKEPLPTVLTQINGYAAHFQTGIRGAVEADIRDRFLWPHFHFADGIGKMVLADRDYFIRQRQTKTAISNNDVRLCSFAKYTDENMLIATPRNEISLKDEHV